MMNTTAATETKNHANRDESVMKHMGAVESVARSVMRRLPLDQGQIEYADLVSVGMLGLLHAFDRHDEGMERFDALVEARVRWAMLDELRRRDFFPRRLRSKAKMLKRTEQALKKRRGRDATAEELAGELGMSMEELHQLRSSVTPYSFVDNETLFDALRSNEKTALQCQVERERREALLEAMGSLTEREQIVLELRFVKGIGQRQIAEVFELTEGRISQIKSKALGKLKIKLADWANTLD